MPGSPYNLIAHDLPVPENDTDSSSKGPVTDYSSTVTHWLRNRLPNYKGSYNGEAERPSASYIVDVGISKPHLKINTGVRANFPRCFLLQHDQQTAQTPSLSNISTHH
jgi:hypothetical protein